MKSYPYKIKNTIKNILEICGIFKFLSFLIQCILTFIYKGQPVRIGCLHNKGRASIMISYIEPYMRKLQLEKCFPNPLIIIINPGVCPNEQLSKMYGRIAWLLDDRHPWLRSLYKIVYKILYNASSSVIVKLKSGHTFEFLQAWNKANPALSFTEDEHIRGQTLLAKMRIPKDAEYICFGLREDAYYNQFLTVEYQKRHDYTFALKEYMIRNTKLKNFMLMANMCASRGLYVLRMGQITDEPLPSGLDSRIIDYAKGYRTPFGDVYLLANCKFVVAGAAGIWWFSSAFNRPVVLTDHYGRMLPLRFGDLFIPVRYWHLADKRFLTFREMLAGGLELSNAYTCKKLGIELVHNTPEEISDVVEEMNQRLNGNWQANEEDDELQKRFKSLYSSEMDGYGMPGRIGAKFLRQNLNLLITI